jgi:phenylacetic acid degradation operon negative regulatory protein
MRKANSVSDRAVPGGGATPAQRRIARWIAAALAADPPRAKSLIVTVWGDAVAPHGGALWLGELFALMAAFGIGERLARTSVFRLAADGWLAGEAHGRRSRYRLTATGGRAFADAYRRIYDPHEAAWDGRWQIVVAPPDSLGAAERASLRSTFAWNGFGALAPGVYARPLAAQGAAIPLPKAVLSRLTVLTARDTGGDGVALGALATRAFDLAALAASYRRYLARFGRAIDLFRDGAHAPDPRQCFVARTLLIHAFRRVLLRDPLLPPALLALDWPGTAAYALTRDFYRLVWRPADRWLATTMGADYQAPSPEFARRFGGLE